MKPCRKLLDVMYEQRATIRARLDEIDGPSGVVHPSEIEAFKASQEVLKVLRK